MNRLDSTYDEVLAELVTGNLSDVFNILGDIEFDGDSDG